MKEILESNLITKYVAGWSSPKEEKELKQWLKTNPQNALAFAFIKAQVQQIVSQEGFRAA
jgi:anti-sigma factor RsiW